MNLKKIILISLVAILGCTLFLSSGRNKIPTTTISFWSYSDELEPAIDYFEERHPGIKVRLTIVPIEDYRDKLRPRLESVDDAPDIIAGEAAFLREFLEAEYFDNLEQSPYRVNAGSLVPYTVDFGRDAKTGAISALSWQVTPGGFFYRRSIAKKVFGTDDPVVIGRKVSTMEGFIETGRILRSRGYFLVPGTQDMEKMISAQRAGPWIQEGNLKLEKTMIDYFDTAKIFYEEGLDAGIGQWSPDWFDSMNEDSKVFGQLLPTWGLDYVMEANAPDSSGDWAVCQPPKNYFWGGSWIGVNKNSQKKEAAWEFVKMICLDPDFSEWWAGMVDGEATSNMPVAEKIKGSFSHEYLGGQNHYAYYTEAAKKISGKHFTSRDDEINEKFFKQVNLYASGMKSKEKAIADFREDVLKVAKNEDKTSELPSNTLLLWSFTDELEPAVEYFEEKYPEFSIVLEIIPTEDYPIKVKRQIRKGQGVPDIFTGEEAFLKQFLDRGYYDNLEKSPYNFNVSSLVPYTVDFGRDSSTGAVSALSWQVTSGGFFYRRSIAKEVFGTDDPAVIGRKISTMDKFVQTGEILKRKGYYLVPGREDLKKTVLAQRSRPWVVDGKLNLEKVMVDYFDTAKTFEERGLDAGLGQWSYKWFDSMGKKSRVFGQLFPNWGLHYVMKPNSPDTSGDWAVCRPPADFFWGGTWIGVYKDSKKKEIAGKFIKMLCLDPDFAEWYAKETGDIMSNMPVVNKIKDSFSDSFLQGQNHYRYFAEASKDIDGTLANSYDSMISEIYFNQVLYYSTGRKSKEQAIADFKEEVASAYPNILVE